jgi:hypothetical protein
VRKFRGISSAHVRRVRSRFDHSFPTFHLFLIENSRFHEKQALGAENKRVILGLRPGDPVLFCAWIIVSAHYDDGDRCGNDNGVLGFRHCEHPLAWQPTYLRQGFGRHRGYIVNCPPHVALA